MLDQIRINNDRLETISLHFDDQRPHFGYLIDHVGGLGPSDAVVSSSDYALIPGSRFHNTTVGTRNITLSLLLSENNTNGLTIAQLRRNLYRVLPTGERVRLRFWTDGEYEMRIDGYVETVEPSIFSKEPRIEISILCPEPYFEAPEPLITNNNPKGLITLYNPGEIVAGIYYRVWFTDTYTSALRFESEVGTIHIHYPFTTGEVLEVDTRLGRKNVRTIGLDGWTRTPLLGRIEVEGDWPAMIQGDNRVGVDSGGVSGSWSWNLEYRILYGGY